MNSKENLKLTGRLSIVVTDPNGVVKDSREVNNLVVESGLRWLTDSALKTANSPAAMTHMAIGDGTTATTDATIDLSGTNQLRKAFSVAPAANSGAAAGTANLVFSTQFIAQDRLPNHVANGNTSSITEAAIFNAATGGTMLCRTVFPVVNKQDNDTLSITWTITLDAT